MANISQGKCSQSMYRNNFSNRCDRHPEYFQCNVGLRQSTFSGSSCDSSSFGMNRRQNSSTQRNHSWSIPEVVRETGLILEVQREYGRILSQTNFSKPNIHIYFSLSTVVNDAPLSVITDNLADVFQVGATVEIEVEGGINLKELKDHVQLILTCNFIKPSTEIGRKPELVPMVVIQDDLEVPLALIANHELVAVPRQVFPVEEVTAAFMAKKTSVTTDVEWPEFTTIGRSIEGRILNAPLWIREFTNPAVKKIALSVQRFGRDREGFAVIKEYIGRGVILTPVDEEDKKICGDLFFPYEMRTDASCTMTKYEDIYRLGSKWYFRACPELPNRKYNYRVYSLNSLNEIVNGTCTMQERFPEQIVNPSIVTNHLSVIDSSTNAVSSTVHQLDDSNQLIEFDNEPLSVPPSNFSLSKATAISPVTINLLNTVDFDTSHAATTSGINETVLLESSYCSDRADNCNLLVNFDAADEMKQIESSTVRQFHVIDEDFIPSFNFDVREKTKCNYETEMFNCFNHENNESICMESQSKESRNADLNHINHRLSTPEVEQLASIRIDSSIIDQEVDTSDDDSEDEMFHAVPVGRQNDDGWWFTRRVSNRTDSTEIRKMNDEFTKLLRCNAGNSETTKVNSLLEDDKPLLILTDDLTKNCETTSAPATVPSQLSLSNVLQNDGH
uniref:Uncharacterized protein n=1 Tax=Onchocerca volvulus TaxID=6282 RepID=A0A2K6VYG0_ONCVO